MEAGKKRLAGDTVREATSDEVKGLRSESQVLKETLYLKTNTYLDHIRKYPLGDLHVTSHDTAPQKIQVVKDESLVSVNLLSHDLEYYNTRIINQRPDPIIYAIRKIMN